MEGLAAFWKGILPPVIMETPKRAVKVCTLQILRKRRRSIRDACYASSVSFLFCLVFLVRTVQEGFQRPHAKANGTYSTMKARRIRL